MVVGEPWQVRLKTFVAKTSLPSAKSLPAAKLCKRDVQPHNYQP
jgi:hypothetical protein